jgi:NAD(P)-dependent dehydrogenase (short-subunit alcohol dehydrogenase family)
VACKANITKWKASFTPIDNQISFRYKHFMYKVLVTGGTKGIGLAIAERLRHGNFEVITCARSSDATVKCDVTDTDQVRQMRESTGPVDILINNAGGPISLPFLKFKEEDWDQQFQWNVKSVFYCTQQYLPAMLEKKWGRIINIASTAGKKGYPYITAYSAAKHAVIGFTRALAQETAPHGITVNAVCPSFVDTPMLQNSVEPISRKTGKSVEEILETFRKHNPQNRFVTPEEVASAVMFLIETPGVNGQAISICGGETV